MSDLEAKIKITAQNETAAGFDGAADAAATAAKQIEDAIANVKARIQAQMADVRKAFQEGLHFNPDSLKDVGAAQEAVFRKITESAKRMYLETRTPMEKFKSELALANKLLEVGAIDVEVELDRLRQHAARQSGRRNLPATAATAAAPDGAASAEGWELLGECASKYAGMAEVADSQAADLKEWQAYGGAVSK